MMSAAMNMLAALLLISTATVGANRPRFCIFFDGPYQPRRGEEAQAKIDEAEDTCRSRDTPCERQTCAVQFLELLDDEGHMVPDTFVELVMPETGFEDAKTFLKENLVACRVAEHRRVNGPCIGMMKFEATVDCASDAWNEECRRRK